jgi:hypothetical protein
METRMPEQTTQGGPKNRRERRVTTHERGHEAPPVNAFAFRINDACRMGGFGRTLAYELVKQDKLKLLRVGGRSLICGDSLRALMGQGE